MFSSEKTWVLVADGAHAKILEYHNADGDLELVPDGEFSQPNLPSRDLITDKPARGFVSTGAPEARGAIDLRTDPHEYEEFRFVRHLAQFLDEHVDQFDNLIVVAAPKALGTLRQKMSRNVQEKVYAQLNKDLVQRPLEEVRVQIENLIPTTSSQRH